MKAGGLYCCYLSYESLSFSFFYIFDISYRNIVRYFCIVLYVLLHDKILPNIVAVSMLFVHYTICYRFLILSISPIK